MVFLPDEAVYSGREVSQSAFRLYACLCAHRDAATGMSGPSRTQISAETGINLSYVSTCRSELIRAGWVKVAHGDDVWLMKGFAAEMARILRGRPPESPALVPTKLGYVYVIKSENGRYKIGLTKNLDARLKSIATACPFLTQLIHSFKTSRMSDLERALHKHFADKRRQREWFELSADDIEWLRNLNAERFLGDRA